MSVSFDNPKHWRERAAQMREVAGGMSDLRQEVPASSLPVAPAAPWRGAQIGRQAARALVVTTEALTPNS
jgi:hypothetical protein